MFFMTFYLENVHGLSPIAAGVHLLPMTAMLIVGSPLAGTVVGRIGPRIPIVAGMALAATAMFGLSGLSATSSPNDTIIWFVLLGHPALVAQTLQLKADQLRDVSCSGATIADLSAPQRTSDGTNPAQLTALTAATTLVTLGIGGNDIGWAAILTRCVELDLLPTLIPGGATSDVAPCQAYYTFDGADQIQQNIQTAAGHLASALTQIKRHAPHARVYVVGYPALLPAAGTTCSHILGINHSLDRTTDSRFRSRPAAPQRAGRARHGRRGDTRHHGHGVDRFLSAPARSTSSLVTVLDPRANSRDFRCQDDENHGSSRSAME
jgi:lysophospholipase L1-like esterase